MNRYLACLLLTAQVAGPVAAGGPPCYRAPAVYGPFPTYAPPVTAQVYYPPAQKAYVAEVVTPAVTTITQYVPVQVPAFSAGYVPAAPAAVGVAGVTAAPAAAAQPAAPAQPTNADLMDALKGINKSLENADGRLRRLEDRVFGAQPEPAPPPMPPAPPDKPADPFNPGAPQARAGDAARGAAVAAAACSRCHDAADGARKGDGFVLTRGGKLAGLTGAQKQAVAAKLRAGAMPPGAPLPAPDADALASAVASAP